MNQLIWFLIAFCFLFLTSFGLKRQLYAALYLLTSSPNLAFRLLSLIFLPGTVVHEAAHLLGAIILNVPTGKISVFPEIDEARLGHLKIAKVDTIRRTLIGISPLFFGLTCLAFIFIFYFKIDLIAHGSPLFNLLPKSLGSFLVFYLIFTISNMMFPSLTDLKPALFPGFILLLVLITLSFYRPVFALPVTLTKTLSSLLLGFTNTFFLTALINILFLLPTLGLKALLEHLTHKKIKAN